MDKCFIEGTWYVRALGICVISKRHGDMNVLFNLRHALRSNSWDYRTRLQHTRRPAWPLRLVFTQILLL